MYTADFTRDAQGKVVPVPTGAAPELSDEASVYRALVLGVRDYVTKHGFPGVVMGLSGGVDSSLTLAIAVDALGADRVHAVMGQGRAVRVGAALELQPLLDRLGAASRSGRFTPDGWDGEIYRADLRRLFAN